MNIGWKMLLRLRFREHWPGKCCCGYGLVDIGLRNIVVAMVLFTSAGEMLLWLIFGGHQLEKCCCGYGLVVIGWRNVAVAMVWWALA